MDIAVRLALTLGAGLILGFNREIHGRPAGLRTTALVALAAALAMIQMNLLLPVDGKGPGSFSVMDVMRMPLGILSGIGFIGGGAILRRGDAVIGVTTAATLWMATVLGLCFGGGQLGLGVAGTTICVLMLWPARWLEASLAREHRARVLLRAGDDGARPKAMAAGLSRLGFKVRFCGQRREPESDLIVLQYELRWRSNKRDVDADVFRSVEAQYRLVSIEIE
jgi:putative Mg2+ transporter-C (MgtC) family protein